MRSWNGSARAAWNALPAPSPGWRGAAHRPAGAGRSEGRERRWRRGDRGPPRVGAAWGRHDATRPRRAARPLPRVRRGLPVRTAPGEVFGQRITHRTQVEAELLQKVAAGRRYGIEVGVEHGWALLCRARPRGTRSLSPAGRSPRARFAPALPGGCNAPLHQDGPGRAVRTERPAQAVAQPERFGQRHGEPRGRDGPGRSSTAMRIGNGPSWGSAAGQKAQAGSSGRQWGLVVTCGQAGRRHGPRRATAQRRPPSAGPRPAGRSAHRRGRAPEAVRAHSQAAVNVAIGDWSVRTSTSSSESRAKARHRATSSQLSKVPWSAPVESATTVYCGG